jgi:GTP cyclohydrolase FolE2
VFCASKISLSVSLPHHLKGTHMSRFLQVLAEHQGEVTMQACDNPVFVEDVVRNAAHQLRADPRIEWFEVRAINHESIHNHPAFAVVTSTPAPTM